MSGALVDRSMGWGSIYGRYWDQRTLRKGAVTQMTRDMGVRLAAEGIRVNAVAPGFIYTALTENVTKTPELHAMMKKLHPIARIGQAEEVANVIALLASEEASFVVGAV